jgi:hypothetical protein
MQLFKERLSVHRLHSTAFHIGVPRIECPADFVHLVEVTCDGVQHQLIDVAVRRLGQFFQPCAEFEWQFDVYGLRLASPQKKNRTGPAPETYGT